MIHFKKVREWAEERNIIKGATPISQFAKLISEHGELAGHMQEIHCLPKKGKDESLDFFNDEAQRLVDLIIDDIGDSLVVMTIIGAQFGIEIENISPDSFPKGEEMLQISQSHGIMADAILKNDIESFKDSVSVLFSLYGIIASNMGSSIDSSIAAAYNDIKDRKGIMYNGTFIKSTDKRYKAAIEELGMKE